MKTLISFVLLLLGNTCLNAQTQPDRSYSWVEGIPVTQAKNVYLLTLMEETQAVNELLKSDQVLEDIAEIKKNELAESLVNCGKDGTCYPLTLLFTKEEVEKIAKRLHDLTTQNPILSKLIKDHIAPSGMYQIQEENDPAAWIANAWRQDANTLNHIITVYAKGEKPNYPKIDSLGMNVPSSNYTANIQALNELVYLKTQHSKLFFSTTLTYAMDALEMAGMDRAGDFEPMHLTVNQLAYNRAKSIDWDDFDYPLILIPGAGTDNYLDSISAGGILRCKLAFQAFQDGMAPFIIVSGGNVHPYKVQHNEAIEMKKYLLKLGAPESAILIDPHARHTTTNMRNTARIMFRYGFPIDRPSITVTTPAQSNYIYSEVLQTRSIKELGYSTYRNGKRLSATIAEFYPLSSSLQIDADEPLDP
ncbi:YdcF family protein [Algoriphagus antarcticus]|uniref:Uncharacterized SAM-binding protein YcdF (DUF218 family) n=1 Tax=Algoriphagus antarcticus TaxID=238540 RepID=A0A3E0D6T8_9BACT|nr:YdcF family protein [Algoriphagus antarcticus]REG78379.1 uncharacterized SAM-binding protein YcdF (DUF218 family) [Algoriphagus antarcticus]